jgi:predicted nuclease of predicted toxin-antitoxin system
MKLLFDNNISFKLVKRLSDILPNSLHVTQTSLLKPASDLDIWNWARLNDYTIVTFDEYFEQIEILNGFPPKVILLRFGNAPTAKLEQIIRANWSVIEAFLLDTTSGLMEIY